MSFVSKNPLLLAYAQQEAAGGISRSLRFNSSDSAYCSRVPASAGNRKTWTWAGWAKRSGLGTDSRIFSAATSGSNQAGITFNTDNTIEIFDYQGSYGYRKVTTQVFRDASAWYHFVLTADFDNGTAEDRILFYVNGVRVTAFSTNTNPSSGYASGLINSAIPHGLGNYGLTAFLNGYLADIYFIDGQALDPSSFTETDATTGQLIPKAYTGSYGTNGFHLEFADNSSNTATTLGKDTSGNSPANNWTPNNFQATVQTGRLYAQASGTSTSAFSSATFLGNFPTSITASYAIYDADLVTPVTSATFSYLYSFSSVVEVLVSADGTNWTSKGNQNSSYTTVSHTSAFRYVRWFYSTFAFGITNNPAQNDSLVDVPTNGAQTDTGVGGEVRGNYATLNPLYTGSNQNRLTFTNGNLDVSWSASGSVYAIAAATIAISSGKWYWETLQNNSTRVECGIIPSASNLGSNYVGAIGYAFSSNGFSYNNGTPTNVGTLFTTGDIFGIALDLDAGKMWFSKNGSWIGGGNPATGTSPTFSGISGSFVPAFSDDTVAVSAPSVSCNFGQRAFAYTAPSGFKALCTANLPAPLVTKPNTVMDVALYTGNGGNQSITLPGGFNPDLVWVKSRSNSQDHYLFDAIRGGAGILRSNTTGAETTGTTYLSFDTSGFSSLNGLSSNGYTYAGWCWDAGSSTVTNTQGSITGTVSVRANTTAGFSIVTYTGNGTSGATVGHGLGVAPAMIIVKNRTATAGYLNWGVYHASLGATKAIYLNTTGAESSDANVWNNTAPSSTVFSLGFSSGNGYNISGQSYVAYCFAPQVGYSSFGSWTGSGNSNGSFIYTGFAPRWILARRTDVAENWVIWDSARETYNPRDDVLWPHSSQAEITGDGYARVDFLSNGFKFRNASFPGLDGSGATYIYAAFAESPFNYARAR